MKQPEFYGSTVVSDKGQVVIPIEARNALGLDKGEKLLVMGMHEDGLMLMKVSAFERLSADMAEKMRVITRKVSDLQEDDNERCD